MSQPRLAARIGYTKQYVSLTERPQRGLPSASLIQTIDDALDAAGVLVALQEEAEAARKACRPGVQPRSMTEEVATTDTTTGREPGTSSAHSDSEEVEDAKRRKVITAAAAIAFGASLDGIGGADSRRR